MNLWVQLFSHLFFCFGLFYGIQHKVDRLPGACAMSDNAIIKQISDHSSIQNALYRMDIRNTCNPFLIRVKSQFRIFSYIRISSFSMQMPPFAVIVLRLGASFFAMSVSSGPVQYAQGLACRSHYLCTRPEPSPFISVLTSATLTWLKSPSIVCLRQEAATANSITSCAA